MADQSNIPHVARIVVDRELCIGAATCLAVAPEVYELDEENKAVVKPFSGVDDERIIQSAKACPVNAIYLYDETGRQIYPE